MYFIVLRFSVSPCPGGIRPFQRDSRIGHYVVLSPDGKPVYDEQIADMFEGSVSISEWGYSYVLGKDASAGKLKVYAVALPGVNSAAASAWSQYGRNARHINYQQ